MKKNDRQFVDYDINVEGPEQDIQIFIGNYGTVQQVAAGDPHNFTSLIKLPSFSEILILKDLVIPVHCLYDMKSEDWPDRLLEPRIIKLYNLKWNQLLWFHLIWKRAFIPKQVGQLNILKQQIN